jgi:NAD-dependent SIR2 family protein deacetylase
MVEESHWAEAAAAIAAADALLIGAGAGMGVDSGLPDFRGDQGFWQAYPPYAALGLSFRELANPEWFDRDPTLAWGFYGHRLNLYRATTPHAGFRILLDWSLRMRHGAFVHTSNVDGHFQRAGFDPERILEVHGAIDWMQCTARCGIGVFAADQVGVDVDETTFRAREPLPACPSCGELARPNVLMFGDWQWEYMRSQEQEVRFQSWLAALEGARLVIVECGAGTAIPTVRRLCEAVAERGRTTLIRINPREAGGVPDGHLGLPVGALEGLRAISRAVPLGN